MELKDILTILLPSLVTVIGFIVTSILNRKNFIQSIQKYKTEQQISDFRGLQRKVITCLDFLLQHIAQIEQARTNFIDLSDTIHTEVLCFGSEDAVKIVSYIQKTIYKIIDDEEDNLKDFLIAGYVLLIMQIKYDTTGLKTSPKEWYMGKFTSKKMMAFGFYERSVNAINNIVDDLKLNDFLKVKSTDF